MKLLFNKKNKDNDDIGFIVDNSYEIHTHKSNKNIVILVIAFIRSPDLHCIIKFLQDNPDGTSDISKEYKKAIKNDAKNKKQYFLIDNIKYYLKHKIV